MLYAENVSLKTMMNRVIIYNNLHYTTIYMRETPKDERGAYIYSRTLQSRV